MNSYDEITQEDQTLFIKNIENVQGDERDIIIFSVAYGENEKGRVINSFGSLSQAGGENRLNVDIARAKKQIFLIKSVHFKRFNITLIIEDLFYFKNFYNM